MIPGEDACCILLYGDIGEYSDVTAAAIVRELMEAEASGKRIDVRINSNGGDVYTGIAIFNALRGSKADIHIYVDGIAAHETGILQYMKDNAIDFRILEEPLLVTGLGIAFAKNDTRGLDSQLTDTLAQMRADGTLERIVGRYLENASQYLEVDTIGA